MSGLPPGSVFPWVVRFVEPGLYEMQECEYIDCIEFIVAFWSLNSFPLNKVMWKQMERHKQSELHCHPNMFSVISFHKP
jgi:hypothetical protein